jgi:hypothetical protein
MLREIGIGEFAHVGLFSGEVALRTSQQIPKQSFNDIFCGALLNHPAQALDNLEEFPMLLIYDPDARVVPRIPGDFHSLNAPCLSKFNIFKFYNHLPTLSDNADSRM